MCLLYVAGSRAVYGVGTLWPTCLQAQNRQARRLECKQTANKTQAGYVLKCHSFGIEEPPICLLKARIAGKGAISFDRAGLWYKMEHFQGCGHVFMQARPGNGCERCGQGVATGCNRVADKKGSCELRTGNIQGTIMGIFITSAYCNTWDTVVQ